ncbi:30S ribosomal protein S5 [Candidatus Micrarchaeota archaeon]|nr:30S ribosomal protein S5 [Candidatus Micrarchaeota archaeon]
MKFRGRFGKEQRKKDDKHLESWVPKTSLGKSVRAGEINSYDALLATQKPILEPEIIDVLLPDLIEDVLEIRSTQRMTSYGRKQQMRAVVLVGNKKGVLGVGIGKAAEVRDAIAEGVKDAKKHLICVPFGSGSWEDIAGLQNSLPTQVIGKSGSTTIVIKPAPRGVGLVAGKVSKQVLELAGLKDAWTFTKGRTRNVLNVVLATMDALDTLNHQKKGVKVSAS